MRNLEFTENHAPTTLEIVQDMLECDISPEECSPLELSITEHGNGWATVWFSVLVKGTRILSPECGYRAFLPAGELFTSPMVGWWNQRLCEGWFDDTMHCYNVMSATAIVRVLRGEKPLALIRIESQQEALALADLVRYYGCLTHMGEDNQFGVCQTGTLGQLFDLESLAQAYALAGRSHMAVEALEKTEWKLDRYFSGSWDALPVWEAGLVLGYPVQISVGLTETE